MPLNGRKTAILALTAALALSATACDDDDPVSPEGLGQQEAEVMTEALMEAGGLGLGVVGLGFGGMAAPAETTEDVTLDDSFPCAGGGSIQISGQLSMARDGESMDWTLEHTHQSCGVTAPSDNSSWTFDGAPSLTNSGSASATEEAFSLEGSQVGEIAWETGDRTGTCGIDVSYSFQGDEAAGSFSGTISGSVCGFDVSQSFDVTG